MSLLQFVGRRLVLTVFVLLGITVLTFVLTHVVPADPIDAYVGPQTPQAQVDKIRHEFGLDKPLPEQYWIYVTGLVHGDLGTAIHDNRPVTEDLKAYFPATLELTIAAILIAVALGVPLGVVSALKRNSLIDQVVRLLSLAGVSVPTFYLALVFLAVFYVRLGWLPGPGQLSPYTIAPARLTGMVVVDALIEGNGEAFLDGLAHLVLPATVLALVTMGIIVRMTRSSMIEVLQQDYMRTARAKGLGRFRVIVWHGLRNALIPTTTVIGLAIGGLLAGAVLTETIFSWPGLGRYAVDSAVTLDIPAIMGVTLLAALVYSIANLLVDLTYALLDPRIEMIR